ncbi:MAG: hypothetical protein ACE5IK_14575, partial [Acidobacteriota bacterium]
LFVNSNGNLTFGRPDIANRSSPSAFLTGPPRIAGLWTNLNPAAAGEVSFAADPRQATFRYDDLPVFRSGGANSFTITLHRLTGRVTIDYSHLDATRGLAGYSCGAALTTGVEPEVDLSAPPRAGRAARGRRAAALFETFTEDDNDLSGRRLVFRPRGLRDRTEPNDTRMRARAVALPYDSTADFTRLDNAGSDVDHFRFLGRDGDILVADTRAADAFLDTVVGLFDARGGQRLAVDDDSGTGAFARLVFPLPGDGLYDLAVAGFPDLDFTGIGESSGRYVLTIRTVRGDILILGDDDAVEVPLDGLSFPFQGRRWSSVFVNSNGNLTFGSADPFPFPTVSRLLSGPPRIAALWDDLDPGAGGLVRVDRRPGVVVVTFDEVPEFFGTAGITFSIELHADGEIRFVYGVNGANDGIVGISPGNGAVDPGPLDLSASGSLTAVGTTYDLFDPAAFDLGGKTLVWTAGAPALLTPAILLRPEHGWPRRTRSGHRPRGESMTDSAHSPGTSRPPGRR